MDILDTFFKKSNAEIWLQICLFVFAGILFGATIFQYPLVDYDEATYADVIMDTMENGNFATFIRSDATWFEKPPLYLWFAMGTVKLFGEHDLAFRLPSVLATLVCLLLVYLILKELTKSPTIAALTSLVLLSTAPFFVFAREARLDSGVIMAILAGVFFFIKGWHDEKYLFWIFPAVAVGFLFKSVIIFLLFPTLFIYSFFYSQWSWLTSKYLWKGSLLSLAILVPWHAWEFYKFGDIFWNEYFVHQVLQRGVSTITGTNGYYDYTNILWLYYRPWLWVMGAFAGVLIVAAFVEDFRKKIPWSKLVAPLLTGVLIVILFTLARTHLSTYIMPAFPFFAIFITLAFFYTSKLFPGSFYILLVIILACVAYGVFFSVTTIGKTLVLPLHYEEREIGKVFKQSVSVTHSFQQPMLYALDWPVHETISYYGDVQKIQYVDPRFANGMNLQGPLYMVTTPMALSFFVDPNGRPYQGFESMRGLYIGRNLVLLYSEKTIKLPIFMPQRPKI